LRKIRSGFGFVLVFYKISPAEDQAVIRLLRMQENVAGWLTAIVPGWTCTAFRAGALCIQPSPAVVAALVDVGIPIDSSIAPGRFVARAGEGCRTNMRSVFDACALDTPYPEQCFSEDSYRQMVIKAVFVGAPLWRMWGLDGRQSPELARMALDLAEERRSAGRAVQHELWLCLGQHAGERGLEALRLELDPTNSNTLGRRGAAYGLARAGARAELEEYLSRESDESVQAALEDALEGNTQSSLFEHLTDRSLNDS
jgi:hypothetical protein